jgi:K+-transporting ATPase ATPase C chain
MVKKMVKQWINGLMLLVVLTLLTGVVYPLTMTALAQVAFPKQANGSLIERDGKVVGSVLLGQNFSKSEYFQGRPSAAGEKGYDATSSSGTNLGPTSAKLMDAIQSKLADVRSQNNLPDDAVIPADLVTSSASGLDPDISLAGAYIQINRVAEARSLSSDQVQKLVDSQAQLPQLGFLGEKRVNVLQLNLALDDLSK